MRELLLGPVALAMLLGVLCAQYTTSRLEGIVQDPLSRPVGNAMVQVEVDGEVVARTQSDAEGVFVLGRCPAGACVVRATTSTPDVGAVAVAADRAPGGFVRIALMPARPVTGVVHDANGAPIAGAWIHFAPGGAAGLTPVGGHTRSDGQGAFAFAAVPCNHNLLRVWADGFAGAAPDVDGTGPQHLDVTLAAADVPEVSFELAHADAPLRAATTIRVSARCREVELLLPPALRSPPLAADGRWWLRGWPESDDLLASAEVADTCLEPPQIVVEADSARRQRQFFVEDPSDTGFRGQLVGEAGCATAGIRLLVQAAERDTLRAEVTTAADGSFALRSPVGLGRYLTVRTLDTNFVLVPPEHSRFRPDGPTDRVWCKQQHDHTHTFTLRPASRLQATLRDANDRPWRGADVTLLTAERELGVFRIANGPWFHDTVATVLAMVTSDARGMVDLDHVGLAAGDEFVLQVAGSGGFLEHRFAATGGLQDLGTLHAEPAAHLSGRALLADGTPAAGARLRLENSSGCRRSHLVAADRDGHFELVGLRPGPCVVSFVGYGLPQELVTLAAGETQQVRIQLR